MLDSRSTVLTLRLDNIEMSQQQDRPAHTGAPQPRDEIPLVRSWVEHLNVFPDEPRSAQSRGHRFGSARGVTGRGNSVDLDELSINISGELLVSCQCLR